MACHYATEIASGALQPHSVAEDLDFSAGSAGNWKVGRQGVDHIEPPVSGIDAGSVEHRRRQAVQRLAEVGEDPVGVALGELLLPGGRTHQGRVAGRLRMLPDSIITVGRVDRFSPARSSRSQSPSVPR